MKRDLDLIRTILLRLEASKEKVSDPTPPEDCDSEWFGYHLEILEEAGFIKILDSSTYDATDYRLTWDGYEYLDAVRDGNVWSKVKKKYAGRIESVPVAVITELTMAAIRHSLDM